MCLRGMSYGVPVSAVQSPFLYISKECDPETTPLPPSPSTHPTPPTPQRAASFSDRLSSITHGSSPDSGLVSIGMKAYTSTWPLGTPTSLFSKVLVVVVSSLSLFSRQKTDREPWCFFVLCVCVCVLYFHLRQNR